MAATAVNHSGIGWETDKQIEKMLSSPLMKMGLLFLSLLLPLPAPADIAIHTVTADDWARPRSGEYILSLPAVTAVVAKFQEKAGHHITIRYPGGEEGILWAAELRDWLVALGIASSHIALLPGARSPDSIELSLTSADR